MSEPELIREWFESEWRRLDEEERSWKLANHTVVELRRIYARLSGAEQQAVDPLLASWVLGDNRGQNFDAEELISDFEIRSAVPALRSARDALVSTDAPTVQRKAKLGRLIERLEGRSESLGSLP